VAAVAEGFHERATSTATMAISTKAAASGMSTTQPDLHPHTRALHAVIKLKSQTGWSSSHVLGVREVDVDVVTRCETRARVSKCRR
jgi:hypothetical protein